MHIQTNHWTEQRTDSRYVGCIGYDDPVYEDYQYTANCSEDVIVFDSMEEKAQFYVMAISMRNSAGKYVINAIATSVNHYREQREADLARFETAMAEWNTQYGHRNWFVREWNKYKQPMNEVRSWEYYEHKAMEHVRKDDAYLAAKIILSIPTTYDKFIDKLYADDYKSIIYYKESQYANEVHA